MVIYLLISVFISILKKKPIVIIFSDYIRRLEADYHEKLKLKSSLLESKQKVMIDIYLKQKMKY